MKKIISVVLSLCLVLCSCGKVNEPLVKRELIDQTRQVVPSKQADETIPTDAKASVPKAKEKIIAIKLFDTRDKKLGDVEITVKDEEEATMNVDSLKELIPENVCNITEAIFLDNEGRIYTLTQEAVSIKDIHDIELICGVPTATPSPTPAPTPTKTPEPSLTPAPSPTALPSASESPEPSLTPIPPTPTKTPVPSSVRTRNVSATVGVSPSPSPVPTPNFVRRNWVMIISSTIVVVCGITIIWGMFYILKKSCEEELHQQAELYETRVKNVETSFRIYMCLTCDFPTDEQASFDEIMNMRENRQQLRQRIPNEQQQIVRRDPPPPPAPVKVFHSKAEETVNSEDFIRTRLELGRAVEQRNKFLVLTYLDRAYEIHMISELMPNLINMAYMELIEYLVVLSQREWVTNQFQVFMTIIRTIYCLGKEEDMRNTLNMEAFRDNNIPYYFFNPVYHTNNTWESVCSCIEHFAVGSMVKHPQKNIPENDILKWLTTKYFPNN
jgi:hypothetical protein